MSSIACAHERANDSRGGRSAHGCRVMVEARLKLRGSTLTSCLYGTYGPAKDRRSHFNVMYFLGHF